MKDFLLVVPSNWSSFITGPLQGSESLRLAGSKAYFGLEGYAQEITQCGQLEMVIDFFDCHFKHGVFNKNTFLNDQDNAVDFHYFFHVDCHQRKIAAASCLFSILPLYYYQGNGATYISNRAGLIVETIGKTWKVNTKFLVEQALFNYSFQNECIYEGIKLLPTNSLLTLYNGLRIEKYFNISDHYCSEPKSIKDSIEPLRDLFIAEIEKYFYNEKSAISFTSGYDGRTLLACSRYHLKKFDTYSFGAVDNDDIVIPQAMARKLNIPFQAMILDEDYAQNYFFPDGKELMDLTDGNNNFLQVHHLYSAKRLARDHDCLLNGMFGSELFRALHISGQVTSKELVLIFSIDKIDQLLIALKNSSKLNYFNKPMAASVLEDVLKNIVDYKDKISKSGLTKNQQFYNYIFEEAFRKYFGYIIAPQLKYINIRSPFLNFNFIKELFKSKLAGVNNDFFTHNPLKRFKGQLLYAQIIEKTDKELYTEKMANGYSPRDLLRLSGRMKIGYKYLRKKLIHKLEKVNLNNLMIVSGIDKNKALLTVNSSYPLFNPNSLKNKITTNLDVSNRDIYVRFLSMINFLSNRGDKHD